MACYDVLEHYVFRPWFEAVYSVKKKTASASLAASKKFNPVCSGKLVVASPLPINGAKFAPTLALQTSGEIAAKTTATLSLHTDAAAKYKYGIQAGPCA